MWYLNYKELLRYNFHIGSTYANMQFMSSWMIYRFRQNVCIINLYKTLYILKICLDYVKYCVLGYRPVWFINLDVKKEQMLRRTARSCGEFFCASFWVAGFLTNFFSVLKGIFKDFRDSRNLRLKKGVVDNFLYWFFTRFSWPRCVLVTNFNCSYRVLKESARGKVPSIGICDTNVKSHAFTFCIPGNDEGIESITFFNFFFSNFILVNKFKGILIWYKMVRLNNRKKASSIYTWLKFNKMEELSIKSLNFDYLGIINSGIRLFFDNQDFFNSKVFDNQDIINFLKLKSKFYFFLSKGYLTNSFFYKIILSFLSGRTYIRSYKIRFKIEKLLGRRFEIDHFIRLKNILYHIFNVWIKTIKGSRVKFNDIGIRYVLTETYNFRTLYLKKRFKKKIYKILYNYIRRNYYVDEDNLVDRYIIKSRDFKIGFKKELIRKKLNAKIVSSLMVKLKNGGLGRAYKKPSLILFWRNFKNLKFLEKSISIKNNFTYTKRKRLFRYLNKRYLLKSKRYYTISVKVGWYSFETSFASLCGFTDLRYFNIYFLKNRILTLSKYIFKNRKVFFEHTNINKNIYMYLNKSKSVINSLNRTVDILRC